MRLGPAAHASSSSVCVQMEAGYLDGKLRPRGGFRTALPLAGGRQRTPGTVMSVYLGSLAGSVAALGTGARARTLGEWMLYTVGLLATVVVTVYMTGKARAALRQRIRI